MIDADDLALLTQSFEAAAASAPDAPAADAAFFELGWADVLEAAPAKGAAAAFGVLGRTGATATLLDDVVAAAVGRTPSADTGVVHPAAHSSLAPGRREGGWIIVDGLVSRRAATAATLLLPVRSQGRVEVVTVPEGSLQVSDADGIDPGRPFSRVTGTVDVAQASRVIDVVGWDSVVAAARAALAQQLIGASRTMLEMARSHAVDRVQFGRPIASFQAIRHKLADSLVAIEGAAAVADCCAESDHPLLAASAKALAGKAALTTAKHAQQTLAGIGFTTDHRFHLFLKRVLVLDTLFGSARTLPAEIGAALVAAGEAPRLVEL